MASGVVGMLPVMSLTIACTSLLLLDSDYKKLELEFDPYVRGGRLAMMALSLNAPHTPTARLAQDWINEYWRR